MKTKLNNNTSPRYCISTLLVAVAERGRFEHSCACFGGVSAGVAWASVRFFGFNYLFLILMYTDQFIQQLITCQKVVTEAPKEKDARSGYTKKVFNLVSVDEQFSFSGFMSQNIMFPENFSVGLVYKPKEERGSITLLRCNGMHGGTIQNPHHAYCHIHTVQADYLNQGSRVENHIEITNEYSTFEMAIQYYINKIAIVPGDRQKHFPPPSGQGSLFE